MVAEKRQVKQKSLVKKQVMTKDRKEIFKRFGKILIDKKHITPQQLELALKRHKETGDKLGETLIKMGFITEAIFTKIFAEQMGVDVIKSENVVFTDKDIASFVPDEIVKDHKVLPLGLRNGAFNIGMEDPTDVSIIDILKIMTGHDINVFLVAKKDFGNLQDKYYTFKDGQKSDDEMSKIVDDLFSTSTDSDENENETEVAKLKLAVEEAPIVKLVNRLISNGIRDRASDVHLEPGEENLQVRYRIDGVLFKTANFPKEVRMAMTSRLKILAGLDIAERRLPQDGRFNVTDSSGTNVDLRVSTLPTINGEKVVLRILRKDQSSINMEKLGFEESDIATINKYSHMPNGIILVTGPTGSGKSTTLYSILNEIKSDTLNIVTVEDPVEYKLDGIFQVHANPKIGLTFAAGLRSILRQDPDVIMVGEIRDVETSEMAVRSSLTGHLVLSTLHTIDSASSIVRLVDMGVKTYMIASSLRLVGAQRLLRKICPKCKGPHKIDKTLLNHLNYHGTLKKNMFYKGKGCDECKGSGYFGRMAIFELLEIDSNIRQMIVDQAPTSKIKKAAIDNGMKTLMDKGLDKVFGGLTTLDEVLRVCVVSD